MSVKARIFGFAAAASLIATSACAETFTTFNVGGNPTIAFGINDAGDVTGYYVTGHHLRTNRGYIRSASGKLSRFSISQSTYPAAIDNAGEVNGYYADAGGPSIGFIRKPGGKIVQFDTASGDIAIPVAINPSGESLAILWEGSSKKGAVRAPGGAITKFQMPKIGGGRPWVTPASLNADGESVGYATDLTTQNTRGFVRMPDGTVSQFDVPDAGSGNGQGTYPTGVSSSGTIAGWYMDSSNVAHGFSRTADGTVMSFDVAGASGTVVVGINDDGTIAGRYFGLDNIDHGFVRSAAGDITTFDAPGAAHGTTPTGINSSGQIVGYYGDSTNQGQVFIRTP